MMFQNLFNKKYATEDTAKAEQRHKDTQERYGRIALENYEIDYINRLNDEDNDILLKIEVLGANIEHCEKDIESFEAKILDFGENSLIAFCYLKETKLAYENRFIDKKDHIVNLARKHPLSYRAQKMVKLLASLTENK